MRQVLVFAYRAVGAGVAIAIMEWLAALSGEPFWRVPFVTSIVLVMTLPQSEAARPYAIVAGHASACVAGFAALHLFGSAARRAPSGWVSRGS
jgi:CBS-domain-containing membrane protein